MAYKNFSISTLLALGVLAGCGGGGGGSTGTTPVVPTPGSAIGTAQIAITIPSTGPTSHRRKMPLYVSSNTNAIAVKINGTPAPASSITFVCNPSNTGTTICTVSIQAPAGSDRFDLQLGDSAGNLLSQGSVTATITGGQVTQLHLTFAGVPARVTLVADQPYPYAGSASTVTLTARVYDASGSEIIGDDYASPIVISNGDATGNLTLSGTEFVNPSSTITVSYNGHRTVPATMHVESPSSTQNVDAVIAPDPYREFGPTTYPTFNIGKGPDGNVWFTECASNVGACKLGKITPAGEITEYADVPYAEKLTAGPDGAVWFTENDQPYLGRITPSGSMSQFLIRALLPNEGFNAVGIVTGPDGNLWFTEGDRIGKMTTAGVVTEYSIGGLFRPGSLVVGADGAFWYDQICRIGRMALDGTYTAYSFGATSCGLGSPLVRGSDGRVYFDYEGLHAMDTSGVATLIPITAPSTSFSSPLTLGPDGKIWGHATSTDPYNVWGGAASVTTSGVLTVDRFVRPNESLPMNDAVWGADGNLWFTTGTGIVRYCYTC